MNWILNNGSVMLTQTLNQLAIALPAIVLALVLSIPLGWLAARFRVTRGIVLTASSVLYAIPSVALLVILPIVLGLRLQDGKNLVVALTLYGIALMVRSVTDGLTSVDPDVVQSATAVGYGAWRRFWSVELPLSGPVLLAGLRVVAVSTMSLTTVGAAVGVQGLGLLFTDGFQRNIPGEVGAGIVLVIVIALLIDLLLVLLGRVLFPWTRSASSRRRGVVVPLAEGEATA